jgi:hypothetical protein
MSWTNEIIKLLGENILKEILRYCNKKGGVYEYIRKINGMAVAFPGVAGYVLFAERRREFCTIR